MPLSPFGPLFSGGNPPTGSTHISQYVSAITGFQPPTSCVAFLFQADNNNASTIRLSTAAAASTLTGHQFEPGRSEYIPYASSGTLSLFPEGGTGVTCRIQLTWFVNT